MRRSPCLECSVETSASSNANFKSFGSYTVEMIAILLALQWVEEHKHENVLISSESVSVLKSLRSFKSRYQDILFSILQIHSRIVLNDTVLYGSRHT